MRSKSQYPINLKLLLLCFFFVFLIFLVVRSSLSASQKSPSLVSSTTRQPNESSTAEEEQEEEEEKVADRVDSKATSCGPAGLPDVPTCTKISPSLAQALVHYATSNVTPQQTSKEISVSMRVLEKKSPCNFLVFGLGHDSPMWTALNHGGRTLFLEEDESWIGQIKGKMPALEAFHVGYETRVSEADELLRNAASGEECRVVGDPRFSKCRLALRALPNEVYDTEWDLIMVDAPTGYHDAAPGRMSAIYTAGLMARNREEGETHVFVHDVDRAVEDSFSRTFLCDGYLREQQGRLRHFIIPSHRARMGRPFCP